jgi:5S rRNA maturation endonuclease (ribonuclease M5)
MQDYDWQKIAPDVARQILGEPKVQKSDEWRWGNKGSFVFTLETGQFYDFEEGEGGGVKWLIERHNKDVSEVLKQFGHDLTLQTPNSTVNGSSPTASKVRSFSREQMVDLYRQSEVKVKYSDNFMVLRHQGLPMKYAPFSLNPNGTWSMKRPEGLLPLYITNKHPEKPVIVNEGEKAMRGAARIWDYDVCCWHGGATGWNKTDWSAIYGRDVYIWADNDEAGIKCANEIAKELKANGCKVKVIQPPETFNDKDDLWDAAERGDFTHDSLTKYIETVQEKKEKGSLTFRRADEVLSEVTNPKWLIKDVCEEESLMQIFGSPKSGKSFVAIAMSCAIATGQDFYGNKAFKKPVLYIVGEGLRGCKRRLSAIQQGMYSLKGAPLYLSDRAVRIGDKDDFERLTQEIEAVKAIEGDIGMIVVDTFQRNFGGGNENSAEDVGNFIHQLDGLIAAYGCNVCIVHHSGHEGNRARGSSVIGASLDYEFKVQRTDKNEQMFVSFQQTLNKDGQGMAEKNFVFKEVDLIGEGLELTSGFLELTDIDFKAKEGIPYKQQLVLNALDTQACIQNPSNPEDCYFYASTLVGKVTDSNGVDLKQTSIKKLLEALERKELAVNTKGVGYQHADYYKLAPKFE